VTKTELNSMMVQYLTMTCL